MKFSGEIEKTDGGVVIRPLYSSDQEALGKLKQNTQYKFEVKQERNYMFHKKFMALMNLSFENQEKIKNFDHFRKVLVMKAGFYDTIETSKGTVYLPHSISFSSMDEVQFEELFQRVLDVVAEQLDSSSSLIKEALEAYY